MVGLLINKIFVGVSVENMDDFWQLYAIQFGCGFIPLFFLYLIPTRADVRKVQREMSALNEKVDESSRISTTENDLAEPLLDGKLREK